MFLLSAPFHILYSFNHFIHLPPYAYLLPFSMCLFYSVERYHCKLNFQSMSSKLSKANISLVIRVGANDNVKWILVFTFKAASVSSVKLLSVLRTRHTSRNNNNNRIQQSSYRHATSSKRPAFIKSETTSFASEQ